MFIEAIQTINRIDLFLFFSVPIQGIKEVDSALALESISKRIDAVVRSVGELEEKVAILTNRTDRSEQNIKHIDQNSDTIIAHINDRFPGPRLIKTIVIEP